MTESPSRRLFGELMSRPDEAFDLAEAALLIACEEYPGLEVSRYLDKLDEMGRAFRSRIGAEDAVTALNRYLFEVEGFRGNTEDYYDPRNSFLNDVLDRRTGIPITLSTVYLEVARRAGLPAYGVGLPGHFIVRIPRPGQDLLVDPFDAGRVLSEDDCRKRLDRIFDGKLKLEPAMLAACSPKQMLARMLRNLKGIYVKADDHARALGIVELLLKISPRSVEDLKDRGQLYAALDAYALAASDLASYVRLVPGDPEAPSLRAQVEELRGKAERVN